MNQLIDFHSSLKQPFVHSPDNLIDLNQLDHCGRAPLHYAVENGNIKVVDFFLQLGANPNLMSVEGITPVCKAEMLGLNEISNLLKRYGGKD